MIVITKEIALRVLKTVDAGLVRGVGEPQPGRMCVEAAVCFALGLPHGDNPPCVSPAVRAFKIALNDSDWSSDAARTKGMRRISIAQLGSDTIDETVFAKELTLATIRRVLPVPLRAVAKMQKDGSALEKAAVECESADTLELAQWAAGSARSAAASAWSAAESAAWSAARGAARSARAAASTAESAAWSAARRSARAATGSAATSARAAAESAAWSASAAESARAASNVFTLMADAGVDALIAAGSPGCKWLSLCD